MSTAEEDILANIKRMMDARESENVQGVALYHLMKQARGRSRSLVRYQCAAVGDRRCLLLSVFQSPKGPWVYSPAYQYSRDEAAQRNLPKRHFPERAYLLEQVLGSPGVLFAWVACNHLAATVHPHVLEDDLSKAPVVRFLPDGVAEATILRTGLGASQEHAADRA